jgi:predicted nuclease with RNAse H fold
LFFGIDLTSKETKPSACLCLNDKLEVVYYDFLSTDGDILAKIGVLLPRVIAIDAPLSLPVGLCCLEESCACQPKLPQKGRQCERQLAKIGVPCYFTTKKSIIKKMVKRARMLKGELGRQGYEVIEIYPYASKVRLFGKPDYPKTTAKGLYWLREKLSILLNTQQPFSDGWNHDLCDAAIAAYTGFLYARGGIQAVGNAEEGLIYIPTYSYGRRGSD